MVKINLLGQEKMTSGDGHGIMNLEFKNTKIKKQCEDPKRAQKEYGPKIGLSLTQRVVELAAADTLADIQRIPAAGLHALKGTREGEYALNLAHPFRLIIRPVGSCDQSLISLEQITVVRIEEVTDYHGKQKRK